LYLIATPGPACSLVIATALPHTSSVIAKSKNPDTLEGLTDREREAVRRWREGGMKDGPEVAALRKRIRGEALTADEELLLASTYRKPPGPTVPHAEVMRLLEERRRRGE
jgi:hypothetical protein